MKKPQLEDFGDGGDTLGYVNELADNTLGWVSGELFMIDGSNKIYEDVNNFYYPNLEPIRAIVLDKKLKKYE